MTMPMTKRGLAPTYLREMFEDATDGNNKQDILGFFSGVS